MGGKDKTSEAAEKALLSGLPVNFAKNRSRKTVYISK
jgi:hypothetical protein